MFYILHYDHNSVFCLAVAGTATLISPTTCGRIIIENRASSIKNSSSFPRFLLKVQCSTFDVECSPPLHLSRDLYKSNIFLQNEPNLYHGLPARGALLSVCSIRGYATFQPFEPHENRPKNKAKQTQFKPNFQFNYVKMGNLECEILSECVHNSCFIFSVLRSLDEEGSPKLASFFTNKPDFKPNIVKMGNFQQPITYKSIFHFYPIFCVACSVSFCVTNIRLCFSPKIAVKCLNKNIFSLCVLCDLCGLKYLCELGGENKRKLKII